MFCIQWGKKIVLRNEKDAVWYLSSKSAIPSSISVWTSFCLHKQFVIIWKNRILCSEPCTKSSIRQHLYFPSKIKILSSRSRRFLIFFPKFIKHFTIDQHLAVRDDSSVLLSHWLIWFKQNIIRSFLVDVQNRRISYCGCHIFQLL